MTAKLAVPTLLAISALLFAFKTVGLGSSGSAPVAADVSQPTPYSADHSRISAGDAPQEPAPTF